MWADADAHSGVPLVKETSLKTSRLLAAEVNRQLRKAGVIRPIRFPPIYTILSPICRFARLYFGKIHDIMRGSAGFHLDGTAGALPNAGVFRGCL